MIRYDTIVEFNMNSKAEYSTRSQKLKQTKQCLFNSVGLQVKIREGSPEGDYGGRICKKDEF